MKLLINLLKSPSFVISVGLFLLTILIAIFGPVFYHVDVLHRVGVPYMIPSKEHWLGTDNLGIDMVSLLIDGLRSSLYVGLIAGVIATVIGTFLGIYAGFKGGWVDDLINMVTNIFLVIPTFVVLILISSSLQKGRSLELIALIIGLTSWTWTTRSVRAQASSLKSRDHIALARVNGAGTLKLITLHILPYLLSYVFMVFIIQVATGVASEAMISMIGLGPFDTVSLGIIMENAMNNDALNDGIWWAFVPATILITVIVFSLYTLNTSMESVFNPRLRK
jgi:peptide/nickel transport system permease protein